MTDKFEHGSVAFKMGQLLNGRFTVHDYQIEDDEGKHAISTIAQVLAERGVSIPETVVNVTAMKTGNLLSLAYDIAKELSYRGAGKELNDKIASYLPKPVPQVYKNVLVAEEQALVETGRHIPAIKMYRARTGAGLKDAKDACDAYRDAWKAAGSPVGGLPVFVPDAPPPMDPMSQW